MAPMPRKRSLADMQHPEGALPLEYNDDDYIREVLLLEDGRTEAFFDDELTTQAEKLGISIARPTTPNPNNHDSMCESANTVASHHARTASSGSRESNSTGLTSRSSINQIDTLTPMQSRKRSNIRRSLSFSEYEKFLSQTQAQQNGKLGFVPPAMPAEPAPSLFSVSTRRSYQSIRNGLKSRFKFRKKFSASREDLKYVIHSEH
jgi:hypothetical protein